MGMGRAVVGVEPVPHLGPASDAGAGATSRGAVGVRPTAGRRR
jgi:hypothetical protein